jgi:hypothetical protein
MSLAVWATAILLSARFEANTLSIGFEGARVVPMRGGKIEEGEQGLAILRQAVDGLVVLGARICRRTRRSRPRPPRVSARQL